MENFHSADHETTIGFRNVDGVVQPVFKTDIALHYKRSYDNTFAIFQVAALRTVTLWHEDDSAYGVANEWISRSTAWSGILQVFRTPNRQEIQILGRIQHSTSYDHRKFNALISAELPKKSRDIGFYLYRGGWPCGVMSYWRNNKSKIKKHLYAEAGRHFSGYPELIRKYLIG